MKKSKFFTLFLSLNKKEIKEFDNFLQGLYTNQINTRLLFDYVKKNQNSESALEKDKAIQKIFKGKKKSTQQRKNIDNILSNLYKYLLEFLQWKKKKELGFFSELQLLSIFKERQLDDLYFQKIEQLKKQITKKNKKAIWDYLHLMILNHFKFYHTNSNKIQINTNQNTLNEAMEELDTFFFLTKLKLSSEMLNRENILQESYSIHFLEEALNYFSTIKVDTSTIYIQLVNFLKEGNDGNFIQLKNELLKSSKILPSDEQQIILTCLLNYLSSEIKKGNLEAYKEAFKLFKFGLKENIFLKEDGYISAAKFNNIVVVGCAANQEFENTIEVLQSVSYENNYFSLRARSLILRCYFELYQFTNKELIIDYCKSYANYINRNKKINPVTAESYFSLIKFVRLMLRKNATKQKLLKTLQETDYVFSKIWIREKINHFKNQQTQTKKRSPK